MTGLLKERHQYLSAVQELLRKGVLGWSAGPAGHLVRMKENLFTVFPVAEATLTPTPKQPLATASLQEGLSSDALALLADGIGALQSTEEIEIHRQRIAISEVEHRRRS